MRRRTFSARLIFPPSFLKLDIKGALKLSLLPAMISIMFTDLFDSISTFVGVSHAAGLTDAQGNPRNLRQGLIVDSLATLGAGLAGTSSGTAFIESVAGIQMGGRSGMTSVFTALCFLPCFFIAPLAASVPPYATAPVLILVGLFMFRSIRELPMDHLEDALPAFPDDRSDPADIFHHAWNPMGDALAYSRCTSSPDAPAEVKPVMYVLARRRGGIIATRIRFMGKDLGPSVGSFCLFCVRSHLVLSQSGFDSTLVSSVSERDHQAGLSRP